MRKLSFATAAAMAVIIASPACAADLPHKDITDPVLLVQDPFVPGTTTGITTVSPSPTGVVIGGQIGCDYHIAPSWVVAFEGAASGSTTRASRSVWLPLGNPDTALVQANTGFLTSVPARLC